MDEAGPGARSFGEESPDADSHVVAGATRPEQLGLEPQTFPERPPAALNDRPADQPVGRPTQVAEVGGWQLVRSAERPRIERGELQLASRGTASQPDRRLEQVALHFFPDQTRPDRFRS